jgi:hypothetical protein
VGGQSRCDEYDHRVNQAEGRLLNGAPPGVRLGIQVHFWPADPARTTASRLIADSTPTPARAEVRSECSVCMWSPLGCIGSGPVARWATVRESVQ